VLFKSKKVSNKLNFKMTIFDATFKKMIKKYHIDEKKFN